MYFPILHILYNMKSLTPAERRAHLDQLKADYSTRRKKTIIKTSRISTLPNKKALFFVYFQIRQQLL